MANNMSSRQACHAARYVVARVLRGLFWCLKYTVILPLATMALMALFVLWKDNTTPGKLLVKEINFVRQTAPAGQFPVSECWFSSSDSSGRSEIQGICHYRAADAADYVRETDRSLMQLVTALWATLALMYVSLAAITGKYPVLYESGITPPLCEVSAPEPDAGGKRIVAYVYKSSRSTVFENPDIVKTCTVRDLKKDFVNCDEKGEGQ
ncbi:conjugal transfer protein TraP [Escherichia coli KTE123]|nr:conjugal transfer protein TraP [Escherichia coli KTE123]